MMKFMTFKRVPEHIEKIEGPQCNDPEWYVCEEHISCFHGANTTALIKLIANGRRQFDAWKLCELLNRTLKENPDFFGEHVEEAGGD